MPATVAPAGYNPAPLAGATRMSRRRDNAVAACLVRKGRSVTDYAFCPVCAAGMTVLPDGQDRWPASMPGGPFRALRQPCRDRVRVRGARRALSRARARPGALSRPLGSARRLRRLPRRACDARFSRRPGIVASREVSPRRAPDRRQRASAHRERGPSGNAGAGAIAGYCAASFSA